MTSVYKMTVNELAKKNGQPVKEFLELLNEKGFDVKSGNKKLTQEDLDTISGLLNGNTTAPVEVVLDRTPRSLRNPNVIIINNSANSYTVSLVEVTLKDGKMELEVIESMNERSKGAALLEYKRMRGMNRVEDIF